VVGGNAVPGDRIDGVPVWWVRPDEAAGLLAVYGRARAGAVAAVDALVRIGLGDAVGGVVLAPSVDAAGRPVLRLGAAGTERQPQARGRPPIRRTVADAPLDNGDASGLTSAGTQWQWAMMVGRLWNSRRGSARTALSGRRGSSPRPGKR
jgi:hypothetical protein